MPPELDEHILATMTDEERASILETQTPEEIAAIAAIASGAEDGPDGDDDELDDDELDDDELDDDGVADSAGVVVDPDAESAKTDTSAAVDTEAPDKAFQPSYQAQLPEDFDAQEAALKEQADALVARFKSGELDFDKYRVEAETLSKSERALNEIRLKASLSQEMAAQTAEQQWNHTVQRFMATVTKAGGIDYQADDEKNADLDLFVRSLARDPKNEGKASEWFLTEAHKRVMALHGIGQVVAPPADAKVIRKPPLDAVPKTLAQVPGGDGPGDVDGNEFSEIDRLTGDAMEAAIAKMSPAQRERYMAGV